MQYRDYYEILGVAHDASERDIKNAFRRLARTYHPDTNKGDAQAEERFKAVNEAYTVLSDPAKRGKYDRFGRDWERFERAGGQAQDFDWNRWGAGGPRMSQEEFARMMGGQGGFGFSSFFEQLFGAGAGAHGAARPAQPPRREIEAEVTLQEAYKGAKRTIEAMDGRRLEASVPPGVKTGSRIRLRGSAEGPAGDIYLRVKVRPDDRFEVRDGDLLHTLPVDLYTAVLGGQARVPTLDGSVQLNIPAGTQPGARMSLAGKGMPDLKRPDRKGKLIVTVKVLLPRSLSPHERELFTQLQAAA